MSTKDNKNSSDSNKYWQSLEEWRNDPEFQKLLDEEFMSSPLRESESNEGGWARREFLKIMGASMALTSFGCVRRPAQKIVAYNKRPADVTPGLPNYYASSFHDGSEGFGTLVRTREGRPVHVEGNELHPINQGAMSAKAQAHLLALYDPNRLQKPLRLLQSEGRKTHDSVNANYEQADKDIAEQVAKGKTALLTSSIVGPSQQRLVDQFTSAHSVKHYIWEPVGAEHMRAAHKTVYGESSVPRFRPDKAKYILSVNSDFLGTYVSPTEAQRLFADGRRLNEDMTKLVAVESYLSFTGSNSDERYRIRPSHSAAFLAAILNILIVKKRRTAYAGSSQAILPLQDYANAHEELGLSVETLEKIAEELWSNRRRSIVVAGEDYRSQVAAALLNSLLGNDGKTIDYNREHRGYKGSTSSLESLIADINSGKIERLIIHDVNPVYSASKDLNFVDALKKLKFLVSTSQYLDETAQLADYVLPDNHQMENWGDLESQKGIKSIQQPTIRPLGDSRAFEETLMSVSKAAGSSAFAKFENWHDYIKSQWRGHLAGSFSGNFDDAWVQLLQDGVLDKTSSSMGSAGSLRANSFAVLKKVEQPQADLELVAYPTIGLGDGSMANLAWLQEFPDPVTKLCWDNYACLSPKLAEKKGIQQGQILELQIGNHKVKLPAHIQPGTDDSTIAVPLGYGRESAGDVGNNIGVNMFHAASVQDGRTVYNALPVLVNVTGDFERMANVAGHNSMEGRQIVVEATFDQYKQNPSANIHKYKIFSAWSEHKYEGVKWGMTIDLNSCTGCSACMIACQSENNIPTVGKKYVVDGREMHWMRIDRYYIGNPDSPDTVYMPVLCQHCDNAPCETVCPVAATVHGDEGTNDMIYNRCVGTRYCSNNCPYKVRRFNWFNYATIPSPKNLALNPDVTVRSRGVMEKCTFCIHRIKSARYQAKLEDRQIRDGEVVTACQSACPTKAITFGNTKDENSKVSESLKDGRSYTLLEEWNAQPAVKYQTKVRMTDTLVGRTDHKTGESVDYDVDNASPAKDVEAEKGGHS